MLRTSTFSEASFSEPLWLGVFSVWMPLLGLWSCLGLPVRHGVYFETISFKLTQKEVLYPLMGPSILNEGFLPKL